jgi:hypothetical protein
VELLARSSRRLAFGLTILFVVLLPRLAIAEPEKDEHRLQWDESKPRIFPGEYVFTALAIAGGAVVEFGTSQPLKPKWVGPILFDEAVRDAVVMPRLGDRKRLMIASDVLLATSIVWPILIDASLLPAIDHNLDIYQQLQVMDLEAYGISYLIMRATHRIFARERPAGIGCQTDKGWAYDCGSFGVNASFFSGHSSMSAVGGGLTCAHHSFLPLYGGGAPDILACVGATTLALTVAATRVVADRHWTSDAISGFILGYGTGLTIPLAFHYLQHVPGKKGHPEPIVGGDQPPLAFSWGGRF